MSKAKMIWKGKQFLFHVCHLPCYPGYGCKLYVVYEVKRT